MWRRPPRRARHPRTSTRTAIVVGTGIFATTLAQLEVLDLPFRQLLQVRFEASPQQTALFFAAAGAPWFLKPIAGLLSDSVPLFGTRRRHYLDPVRDPRGSVLVGARPGGLFAWLWTAARRAGLVEMNAALVVASTVIGGLIAEKSREFGSAKRLVSARGFVEVCPFYSPDRCPPGWLACRSKPRR